MTELSPENLETYLCQTFGKDARILHVGRIGRPEEQGMKTSGLFGRWGRYDLAV